MRVQIILADAAQVIDGKIYLLGGGWNQIGPARTPMSVVLRFLIPWDMTNKRHHWQLRLHDADGDSVSVPTPEGDRPIEVSGEFEAGRPAGSSPGTEISIPVAVNLGPLPLPVNSRLEWRLYIDGQTHDDWREAFQTRAPNPNS